MNTKDLKTGILVTDVMSLIKKEKGLAYTSAELAKKLSMSTKGVTEHLRARVESGELMRIEYKAHAKSRKCFIYFLPEREEEVYKALLEDD